MSDIRGRGFGSAHDWIRGYSSPDGFTEFECRRCRETFRHFYHSTPNIWKAMREQGVLEECEEQETEQERNQRTFDDTLWHELRAMDEEEDDG